MYYFVYSVERYRVPIEPEMTILCVFLVTEARREVPEQSRRGG
jgi:hypothetical protein